MSKPARPKALDAALAYLKAWARRAASLGSGERKRVSVVATPTPKLKVTVDTDSANVERILTALGQVESDPDTVALTGQDVGVRAMSSYQPTTIALSRPEPDVGAAETAFLAAALSGAPSPKQARDKLRLLYVHRHEGRDVFVSDDVDTFDAPGSKRRQRLNGLVSPARVRSTEEFEQYCRLRQTTGRWG